MAQATPLSYESVCTIVGRLYLESRAEVDALARSLQESQARAQQLQRERDEAIRAFSVTSKE